MSRAKRRKPRPDRLAARQTNPEPHSAFLSVPMTRPATVDDLRVRAYYLWEHAGRPEGDGVEFWLMAEREMR